MPKVLSLYPPSLRLLACGLALLSTLSTLATLAGQGSNPVAAPRGLTVVFVDVGQGDATVLLGPTGKAMVCDAGRDGQGSSRVLPILSSLGVKTVDYALASHYDADHIGGLDEVIDGTTVVSVFDRGLSSAPSHTPYLSYVKSAGTRRRQVQVGQVFDLGGGAKATVLAANGVVLGGKSYPIGGSRQFENTASVVLKVEYGDFDLWIGGDLTGGGNQTYDMESKVAAVCGDIDVYQVDHHGSNTSTSAALIGYLKPEVCVASAGYKNPYGHPTTAVTNRINPVAGSRLFLCTSSGANAWQGYSETGTLTLTTDGHRYRLTGARGHSFDVYTDEVVSPTPPAGSLRISELHRRPTVSAGEYLEIHCTGPSPVNLRGLKVQGNQGSFTLAVPYRMLPGDTLLLSVQGNPSESGGLPLSHSWPYKALSLGDSYDTLQLRLGSQLQDSLTYGSTMAGGVGVAAERVDLRLLTTPANFRAATQSYATDKGTPGSGNSVDATTYVPVAAVETIPHTGPGGAALHLIATAPAHKGQLHQMAMSIAATPGMTVLGTHIPLNPDALFDTSLRLVGMRGTIQGDGRRGLRLSIPYLPGLRGFRAVYAHVILDPVGPVPFPAASNAAWFAFP